MQLNPYLFFDGDCEAAFKFYAKVLDGEIETIMKGRDTPDAAQMPPGFEDKVMHAALAIDGEMLMGSDAPTGRYNKPQGFAVSIQIPTPTEAERVFNALADGGTTQMPIAKTFWAQRFGMCVDRFGTHWMINCP